MYIKNSMGPRTVSWETPERTGWGRIATLRKQLSAIFLAEICWIQVCVDPLMPYQLSLYCIRLCGTLSKALLKSMMIISVCKGLLDRSWKRERS